MNNLKESANLFHPKLIFYRGVSKMWMWKDSIRNIVVIFQTTILRIVGFYSIFPSKHTVFSSSITVVKNMVCLIGSIEYVRRSATCFRDALVYKYCRRGMTNKNSKLIWLHCPTVILGGLWQLGHAIYYGYQSQEVSVYNILEQ